MKIGRPRPYERLARPSRFGHRQPLTLGSLSETAVVGDEHADLVANAERRGKVKRIETAEAHRVEGGGNVKDGVVEWKQRQAVQE